MMSCRYSEPQKYKKINEEAPFSEPEILKKNMVEGNAFFYIFALSFF